MKHAGQLLMASAMILASHAAYATPLTPGQQGAFAIVVTNNCYSELEAVPEFAALKRRMGYDISRPYCGCMASRASTITTQEDLAHLGASGALPPALQQNMLAEAKNCMTFSLSQASR